MLARRLGFLFVSLAYPVAYLGSVFGTKLWLLVSFLVALAEGVYEAVGGETLDLGR